MPLLNNLLPFFSLQRTLKKFKPYLKSCLTFLLVSPIHLPSHFEAPCELFVKTIETEREKRWKDKKKKKKEDFYIQENILAFYAKIAAKAAPYYYDSSEYFMRAMRELVSFCIANSSVISGFHSLIRTSISEILDRFIFLEGTRNFNEISNSRKYDQAK